MCSVARERWGCNGLRGKGWIRSFGCFCLCLVPCDELTNITEIIANRSRSQIFLLTEHLLILSERRLTGTRQDRVCHSFHTRPRVLSKTLAEMRYEGSWEH